MGGAGPPRCILGKGADTPRVLSEGFLHSGVSFDIKSLAVRYRGTSLMRNTSPHRITVGPWA